MLQYERIDISDRIGINISNKSKKCMIGQYWYFNNIGYKFELYVCNGCRDISMMAYELKNIVILNVKGVDYRCILWNMTKNDAINTLGNSKLGEWWRHIMNMNFGANKTPVEVIKKVLFGGTYFRDIYSSINGRWYRK